MSHSERIEQLRNEALNHTHCNHEFYYHFYKQYSHGSATTEEEKYANAFYFAFSNLTPSISDGELIVGKLKNTFSHEQQSEWETIYQPLTQEHCRLAGGGQDSHMAIDYDLLLSVGLHGIIEKIDHYRNTCTPDQIAFYECAKTCLEAVIRHSENYAAHALKLAEREVDPTRKEELLSIARICNHVPAHPATSFYEAVQSVHFVTYCLSLNPLRFCSQQFQLGHPDRYLLPYYERDLSNGTITREKAQELLDCLAVQINLRVPSGLSSGYMVGGRDKNGKIIANDLTAMLMQVIDRVRLVYPAVGLCYTPEMPESYLDMACEILSHGRSHPAIFNDDVISHGLESWGVPPTESHDYIHSTCVEITPVASSNIWVASPYLNMAQLLLDTMSREYGSEEEHISAIFDLLDERIKQNALHQNELRTVRSANSMNPLLSCFVNDCLARGVDIEKGGARYNWIMPSFVGMANLVDSLYALKKLIYEEKRYTICEFKQILDNNFDGNESLRQYLLHALPKYGNNIGEVDHYFGMLTEHIIRECKKYEMHLPFGKLIPSVFCWIMHEQFGKETKATPDGRQCGFPLGDGSGPCQGREQKGPTASILSSTTWKHHELIGGVAVNMKFSKSNLGSQSLNTLKALIQAYIARGGFELQINVTDRETLKQAQEKPEEYRDLIVRIGGYSDYFTRLSPQMQEEVILRTEHKI